MTFTLSIGEINPLQHFIMEFVDYWAKEEKTPVPLGRIKLYMRRQGVGGPTTINALNVLLRKGYIRRAITLRRNTTAFVQCRGITRLSFKPDFSRA